MNGDYGSSLRDRIMVASTLLLISKLSKTRGSHEELFRELDRVSSVHPNYNLNEPPESLEAAWKDVLWMSEKLNISDVARPMKKGGL